MYGLLHPFMVRSLHKNYSSLKDRQGQYLAEQNSLFTELKDHFRGTKIATETGLDSIESYHQLIKSIPPKSYDYFAPFIDEVVKGEKNILFKDPLKYFALTSGTSGKAQKLLPINKKMVKAVVQFQRDMASHLLQYHPNKSILTGRKLTYTNDFTQRKELGKEVLYISGIYAKSIPWFLRSLHYPKGNILQITDWDEKMEALYQQVRNQSISIITGIPIYIQKLMEFMAERAKVKTLNEIWPDLQLILYAGSAIGPYQQALENLAGHSLNYAGLYASTEAPLGFAIGSDHYELNTSNILYSFNPVDNPESVSLGLDELTPGAKYYINITTPNGLIQYQQLDILEFTEYAPHPLFKILGRKDVGINIAYEKYSQKDIDSVVTKFKYQAQIPLDHFFLFPRENEQRGRHYHFKISVDQKYVSQLNSRANKLEKLLDDLLMDSSNHYQECRLREKLIGPASIEIIDRSITDYVFYQKNTRGQFKMKAIFKNETDYTQYIN